MGAQTFATVAKGKTAQKAFDHARDEAAWEHGHGGYTGTIAEKSNFVMIPAVEGEKPMDTAERLIDEGDPRVDDKWGPAGCIDCGDGKYLFFGWASS